MSTQEFSLQFGARLKAKFETNKVVSRFVDDAKKAVIKQAAYIRRVAKSSIRPANGKDDHSLPGKPPKSHTGLLRNFIYFDFDNMVSSVVIGPALLQSSSGRKAQLDLARGKFKYPVPQMLEEGGPVRTLRRHANHANGGWYYTSDQMAARPYMAPAFERSKQELPRFWKQAQMGV